MTAAFHYDPFSPQAMRDPHAFYPVLREAHPAWFLPEYDAYVFSRFQDVWDGFMDAEHFSEAETQVFSRAALLQHHRGNPPPPRLEPEKAMFLWLDPPVHTRFRQAFAAPFLKGAVAKLEPHIRALTRRRLTELLPRGRFDINSDYASRVAVQVTIDQLGLEIADPDAVIELFGRVVARAPGQSGITADGLAAREEALDLLGGEVRRRRAGKGRASPFIDPLLQRDLIGRPLTDREIAIDVMSTLAGGTETVPKIIAGGLLELARRPRQLAAVRANLAAHAPQAWEEMLRYNAPAQWFGRTVRKPVRLGGVDLEPGQRVILLIASANRDPREFERADEFEWNRKPRRMLSFGVGPHFCIGVHLARLEGAILIEEFLRAAPTFALLPDEGTFAESEFQVGWTSLPVRVGSTGVAGA
ncbi:MAG: cytochrome P450 [Sphingomonadales bacterium]|nr:cytochrome P450 [Sphingomonadales bacterium]